MVTDNRSREELVAENKELRSRLEETEETLHALGSGAADALVVSLPDGGEQVFTLQGAEHPYRVLIETMNEGAVTVTSDGTILYCNKSMATLLQVPLEKLIGTTLLSYVAPADSALFAGLLKSSMPKPEKGEISLLSEAGKPIPVLFSCCSVELSGIQGMNVLFTDITELKQVETQLHIAAERERASEALKESNERYRSILLNIQDAFIRSDKNGIVTIASPSAAIMFGYDSFKDMIGLSDLIFYKNLEYRDLLFEKLHSHGKVVDFEAVALRKDGTSIPVSLNAQFYYDAHGKILGIEAFFRDITERRQAEEETRQLHEIVAQQRDRLSALVNSITDEIWFADSAGKFTLVNPSGSQEFTLDTAGVTDVRKLAASLEVLRADGSPRPAEEAPALRALRGEIVRNQEELIRTPVLGELRHRQVSSAPVRDAMNNIIGSVSVVRDITERKQAEEELKKSEQRFRLATDAAQASLLEKEVLLKEIHHRVKNNLQVISSLVNLQANTIDDPAVHEHLRDVSDRVRSMALVHEKLYQSENLSSVPFEDYVSALLQYLIHAHGSSNAAIRFRKDLQPVSLCVETAVPCGLILNELISNTLKHAFRGRSQGEVRIVLHRSSDGTVCLCVSDDGVGLPPGLDWRQSESLGLRLVQMLTRQLNATMELNCDNGTEFQLTFKLPQVEKDGERARE